MHRGDYAYAQVPTTSAEEEPAPPPRTTLRNREGHRLGYEMSQRGVTRDDAPPAPYNAPPGAPAPGAAGARDAVGDLVLEDDEAVARALQDEYDREHSDLRQQANRQQPLPDYRSAGYADPHASTMPSTVPAACTMCQGVTPVPYAPGRLQFRCDRCGFMNTCTIPRGRPAYGDDLYYDRYGMPLICNIQ